MGARLRMAETNNRVILRPNSTRQRVFRVLQVSPALDFVSHFALFKTSFVALQDVIVETVLLLTLLLLTIHRSTLSPNYSFLLLPNFVLYENLQGRRAYMEFMIQLSVFIQICLY